MVDQLDPNATWPCPRCRVPQIVTAMYCANCGQPLGAAPPGPPVITNASPPAPAPVPSSAAALRNPGFALAGALIAGGSLLPWFTLSTGFASVSRNGIEGGGDGTITLIIGVVLILAAFGTVRGIVMVGGLVLSAVALYIAIHDGSNVATVIAGVSIGGTVGAGLWVIGIGAVLGLASSLAAK